MEHPQTVVNRFYKLASEGKSAALDFNQKTSEFIINCTKSGSGEFGNGTPGICYTDDWIRVALCLNGRIQAVL